MILKQILNETDMHVNGGFMPPGHGRNTHAGGKTDECAPALHEWREPKCQVTES